MPRVIISSGHTSANPGSVANGLREVDVARQIAKATLPYLRKNGVIALSVPPELDVARRIDWVNKTGYSEETNDVAIELHVNDGGRRGIEIWYEGEGNNKSEQLAKDIMAMATDTTKLPEAGIHSEYDHDLGSLAFLHDTDPVTVLIEAAYIDNPEDAKFLKDPEKLKLMGKGIAKGILKFLNIEYKEVEVKTPVATTPAPTTNPVPVPAAPAAPPTYGAPASAPPPRPVTPGGFNAGMPAAGYGGASAAGSYANMPSREERRELIKNNYIKILGREPNQNDLNYFLNIGITEDQLIKKMIDSQEHADLVKARQEVIKIKQQFNDQQAELQSLRTQTTDQQKIIANLQSSIDQKNLALGEQQSRINNFQSIRSAQGMQPQKQSSAPKYKGTFLERLFRAFSDLFE